MEEVFRQIYRDYIIHVIGIASRGLRCGRNFPSAHFTESTSSNDLAIAGPHSLNMQKVIQRTAAARKQAQKKLFRARQQEELVDRKDTIRTRKEYNRAMIDNLKEARNARWEDWKKGELAPKRDTGLEATTYGALDPALMHPPRVPKHLRRKHILFAPGDRVCVIRGRDQGKIEEITQVNEESETLLIKNVNEVRLSPLV
jgi:large subunit ribosomal protein L24